MLIEQLGTEVRTELVEQIDITDDDIDAYYQENLHLYDISEVAHIYIRIQPPAQQEQIDSARKKANEALARLKSGARFSAVAREYSEDANTNNTGGVLGPVNSGLHPTLVISAVSELEAGEYTTEPLQVQDDVRIIKRLNEKYQPIEDVADSIRQALMQVRVETAFVKWIDDKRSGADVQIYL